MLEGNSCILRGQVTANHTCTSRAQRVLLAYTDDRVFSVDLVGAVIRQCAFVDKMYNFGWTEPGYFDHKDDELVLVHSIARYHAYVKFHYRGN